MFPFSGLVVKQCWSSEEKKAVLANLGRYISSGTVPGKAACEACLRKSQGALRGRTWLAVKYFIKNEITRRNRKVRKWTVVRHISNIVGNWSGSLSFQKVRGWSTFESKKAITRLGHGHRPLEIVKLTLLLPWRRVAWPLDVTFPVFPSRVLHKRKI